MAMRARDRGIKLFGGTLTPFENETFMLGAYAPEGEAKRIAVDDWIGSAGAFDAAIDFDKGLRDPDHGPGCCRYTTTAIICLPGMPATTGWAI